MAAASSVLRKSAYGRTQLFLPDDAAIFREVKCMGGITRRDAAAVYHTMGADLAGAACWHCCEPIADGACAIPIPRVYDARQGTFHVYGRTCSPSCAKAYVLEHTSFDRGQHLNVLVKMLREVYGVTGPVHETPPRPALRRFGGVFDPRAAHRAECRLIEPPFVSYCMLLEERVQADELPRAAAAPAHVVVEEADTLDEPHSPPRFAAFARERAGGDAAASGAARATRKRAVETQQPGPMSKFMRASEP